MTIALVLPKPPAYSETFFRSKIKGLQDSGHKVVLVTATTGFEFEECEHLQHPEISKDVFVQVLRMVLVFASLIPYLGRVKSYLTLEKEEGTSFKRSLEKLYINATLIKLNSDWIHFGFATMAIDRELVGKVIGAKLAVSFRGYDIGVYPLKHPGCYHKLWSYVDQVHYISDDLYEKALNLGLSAATTGKKITPAINTDYFKPSTLELKGVAGNFTFLTLGRLHWKKGFVDTLKALKLLKLQGINFMYNIVGEGPDYERIAFAAYQLGMADQVRFLGKLDHKDVKEQLDKADIYLQYSIQEGFCNAVLEAQALGKLCLVSDAEGLSENVLNGKTGWVVPRLQPELLAQKILEVINLPDFDRNRICQNAIERVQDEFNIEKQRKEFNQFYSHSHAV
ncbi:MAG: glycosyltransferase family 4 protein [Nonlabens sp.]